jgi:hypothetical protein
MLTLEARGALPPDVFSENVAKMHPNGYPDHVSAAESEPLPGRAAMNVYLKGQNATEKFFYRILMVGGKGTGYKVAYIGRGNGPYPPSNRHSL